MTRKFQTTKNEKKEVRFGQIFDKIDEFLQTTALSQTKVVDTAVRAIKFQCFFCSWQKLPENAQF